ncbi:hypothetical protein [Herbiconiux sp.]|uniref:hypothetical protein n=1 Tax=Herbiconiux sp. TaxID=1871186 RepID=UPI0025C4FE8A|nr:hypothetical protein [Herbiconiux sp.]
MLGVLALIGGGAAPASAGTDPGEASIGIRLVDVPEATLDDPRARNYIVDNVVPGSTIQRRVEVSNEGGTAQTVTMYATSARIVDGEFTGDAEGSENELSSWTALSSQTLELEGGESSNVTVTIAVPADAAEGEQYAAVWAQVTKPAPDGSMLALASRAGVRLYVSVGPGNGPPADFTLGTLTAERSAEGMPRLVAVVTNTGGRAVDVSGTLTLTEGPGSMSAGPFSTANAVTIPPGGTHEVSIDLDPAIVAGPWTANLALTSGLLSRTATAEVTFPAEGVIAVETVDAGLPPWVLVAGGAAAFSVVAAVVILLVVRRRSRS